MSASSKKKRRPVIKALTIFSICLYIVALCLLVYDANMGGFLFGKTYGPGAYYFTDVPGWSKVFLDSPHLGFQHPVICMGFFVGWAILMYRFLIWVNEKF